MSTQVGYESNHIALLCDSVVSDAQNFYKLFCNLKEKDLIRRKISCKKVLMCEINILILICWKL